MRIEKGRNGWAASTDVELPDVLTDAQRTRNKESGQAVFTLRTGKNLSGGLRSIAEVAFHGGGFRVHAMGFGTGEGDYYEKVLATNERCTKAAVERLHAEALAHLSHYLNDARAFYAAKDQS